MWVDGPRWLAIATTLAVVWPLAGCDRASDAAPGERARPAIRVETVQVVAGSMSETVRGIGTVRAADTVEIRSEIAATVLQVHFAEGTEVAEGELLYTLDDRKLRSELAARRAALTQARAGLHNAETRFGRVKGLYARDAVSENEYDRAETDLDTARAQADRARAQVDLVEEQLRDSRIYAPFTGPISESLVDRGDFVQVGERLATLYRISTLELDFRLPERFAGRVERGQAVAIQSASYPDRSFASRVDFVSPAVDEATRDFLVKASIPNPEGLLKPGSFATAVVTVEERRGRPVIPEEALVAAREGYLVFVVRDGVAELRRVDVGLREPGRAEIASGLDVGEVVVRSGHSKLSPGDPVDAGMATPPVRAQRDQARLGRGAP